MGRSEYLADRCCKIVVKYCVVFWDEKNGFTTGLVDSEKHALECGGFGNFTGYSKVECVVPIGANTDD